jgi:hypothetical protein
MSDTKHGHRKPYTFYMDLKDAAGLKAVKDRDGISESEQIRRAIKGWLEEKGIKSEGDRVRTGSVPRKHAHHRSKGAKS